MEPLENQQYEHFAQLVAGGLSQTDAYVRAGFSKKGADGNAARLAARDRVAHRIAVLRKANLDRLQADLQIDAEWIKAQFLTIARADVNELVEVVVRCCRYCHGDGHKYQWIDEDEFADAHAAWRALSPAKRKVTREPTDLGGYGFYARNRPMEDCPRCLGAGQPDIVLHPSKGHPLFAGAKWGKAGIEVKVRDPQEAVVSLARVLGVYQGEGGANVDAVTAMLAQFRALLSKRQPGGAGPVFNYAQKARASRLAADQARDVTPTGEADA